MLPALSLLLLMSTDPTPPMTPPPQPDCTAAEFRQFAFWLGEWEVSSQGKPVGVNRIEADLDGCLITEHWRSHSGVSGRSLNVYDRTTQRWRQFWVDNQGGVLQLEGESDGEGSMRLQSNPNAPTRDRIHWQRQADGSVRQRWEQSTDGGQQWNVVFDGLYRKSSVID